MAQGCLGTLYERLLDVSDSKGGFVGRRDLIVDDGGQIQRDVVFRHADLARDLHDLDLHVDGLQALAQWVDFDETRVDCAFEAVLH